MKCACRDAKCGCEIHWNPYSKFFMVKHTDGSLISVYLSPGDIRHLVDQLSGTDDTSLEDRNAAQAVTIETYRAELQEAQEVARRYSTMVSNLINEKNALQRQIVDAKLKVIELHRSLGIV